jgi:DNA-directed RNA polymerase specialized sigma subunit
MQDVKKRLPIVQSKSSKALDGTTCFSYQEKSNVDCQRQRCQHWIDHPESNNCVVIAAGKGPHTLQKIGQIYGLTRMRICQIEKSIFEKIRSVG